MNKLAIYVFTISITLPAFFSSVIAQHDPQKKDTFFLAKKKGLLGKFGESISISSPSNLPQNLANPFLKFKGKIIRSVEIVSMDFGRDIYDTIALKKNFGNTLANIFHTNTRSKVVVKNLFFKVGDIVYPYLIADNERYLRDLSFIEDARILLDFAEGGKDSVDVVIITKDVFSLEAKVVINTVTKGRFELKEDNIFGTGDRVMVSGFYDKVRNPQTGFGAEIKKRNISGTFIDLIAGYKNFQATFNSGNNDETVYYFKLEKPLVTPYKPSTGAIGWMYHTTSNNYVSDSLYNIDFKYAYYAIDGWLGYSLDSKRSLYMNREIKVHRFIALRGFTQQFQEKPFKYKYHYDYRYTDFTGALATLNYFKQTFYKTNFIYGFGRNEDIPEGYSLALTAGYINKEMFKRPYLGIDIQLRDLKKRGSYFNYTFRTGGYFYKKRFEDIDFLASLEYFSRLKKLGTNWYQRSFVNTVISAQANPALNAPLFLNSEYGLPYINNEMVNADVRATIKGETVFYNTKKIWGFSFAPFVFADISLLKPTKLDLNKTDLYSALGAGVRTRNENLIFGTIELKGYYFPRTNGTMNNWKVDLSSNIRFKYRSSFIRRPDFINAN